MVANEKEIRGRRLIAMTKYGEKLLPTHSDIEIRQELIHYARRNYGVSEGTVRSYVETVIARLNRDPDQKGPLDAVCMENKKEFEAHPSMDE